VLYGWGQCSKIVLTSDDKKPDIMANVARTSRMGFGSIPTDSSPLERALVYCAKRVVEHPRVRLDESMNDYSSVRRHVAREVPQVSAILQL